MGSTHTQVGSAFKKTKFTSRKRMNADRFQSIEGTNLNMEGGADQDQGQDSGLEEQTLDNSYEGAERSSGGGNPRKRSTRNGRNQRNQLWRNSFFGDQDFQGFDDSF